MEKQAWHDWRNEGVGASDAPVIMGVSPWKTYRQLWEEKVFGAKQEENYAMKRGKALEPLAVNFFMTETGILINEQVCLEHPEHPWMRATLDGYNEKERVLVEIKSCKELHEEVPEHYFPQLQHQMEVAGVTTMYYVSFNGEEGKILQVEKDEAYVERLIEQEKAFWEKVKSKEEPLLEEGDYRLMEDNEGWADFAQRYIECKKVMEELKEEISFLESQFILFAEGNNAQGRGIRLSKVRKLGRVNYSKAVEGRGLDLEKFRGKPIEYWQVRVTS